MTQLADGRVLVTFTTDSSADGDTSREGISARIGTLTAGGTLDFDE
ncbi:hypothetical protein [Roseibium sp.]